MKQPPAGTEEKIGQYTLAQIYPAYVAKLEKKGRTTQEFFEIVEWLTGYDEKTFMQMLKGGATFRTFFDECKLHPNAHLITGSICGYRVETLENPFIQKARYLDKLVDELAKGKAMEKVLRTA